MSNRGGRRDGSGRKKGSRNKATVNREQRMREVALALSAEIAHVFEGDSHALLMAIYKNEDLPLSTRLDAAKAAIPFEKPRLNAIDHSGAMKLYMHEQALAELEQSTGANGHEHAH